MKVSRSLALFTVSLVTVRCAPALTTGEVHYLEDLKTTLEQVLKKTPFVIVDLYAQWCGPCKSMSSILDKIARSNPDVLILKVDIEQFDSIRIKYNVKSIPTLLVFKNGRVVSQEVGVISEQNIQVLIEKKLK